MDMTQFRFFIVSAAFFFVFLSTYIPFSSGQDITATNIIPAMKDKSDSESIAPLEIKLSVNEVRLDVVVLDKKGNQITDLAAADFEVYQDNKRQDVKSSIYIDNQSNVALQPAASIKSSLNNSPYLSTELDYKDVRRTIVFIFDDSISFQEGYYAKMALRNFVEKQMQPGDLIAIFNTVYSNNALQMFHSDKRQLLARIDAIPVPKGLGVTGSMETTQNNQSDIIRYSIRALKDMPGRKILILMAVPNIFSTLIGQYNHVADEALRAGVVINHLDIRGLHNYFTDASIGLNNTSSGYDMHPLGIERMAGYENGRLAQNSALFVNNLMMSIQQRVDNFQMYLSPLTVLPSKTGGLLIQNSNFFLNGIGKETESLMKGYYLVSYSPPQSTFESDGKEIYHQIKIKVKRKGAVVHTRDGFYNHTNNEIDDTALKNPLWDAIFSPFRYVDLNVNIAAGYVKNAKEGYLVRSWIHIAPEDMKIVETENGGAQINLEAVCLTSDTNGFVQDLVDAKYTFSIAPEKKAENIAWIQKHGVRFSLLLPVKKPGSYYVRISVKDTESGKTGSAYQYLEIPDLGKKGLALSNIFMIASPGDLEWIRSDATQELSQGLFFPVFQAEDVLSPALRTYEPGDNLQTLAILYNADVNAVARSEIDRQYVLYRDGQEFLRGELKPVNLDNWGNPGEIPFLQTLKLGSDMTPGDYALQLISIDKKNIKKKEGNASQTFVFRIVENQTCETGGNICLEQ